MQVIPGKETLIRFLSNISLFSNAGEDVLSHLTDKIQVASHPTGTTVIRKGDIGETMFLIFSGSLKVHDGEHQVARLEKGQFFGELSLLDSEPRSMSVSTLEDTVLGSISRDDFYEVLKEFPSMTRDIIAVLNKRLRNQNDVLISEYRTREAQLTELVNIRTAEVIRQSQVIAEKNKELTDSLNYAKRLQAAILPKRDAIHRAFPDSFIVYQPKDIVSGDFYSFEIQEGREIIAAADCTGHGVSGAIMSMIGHALLKQIVAEKKITDPSQILHRLNEGVIEALKQSENNTHDGMDIALCSFDMKNRKLVFAGANRPLWLIRRGELQTVASDKLPIGGLQIDRSRPFTNNVLDLEAGDAIYIFSDGFADQFGGEMGKKLMTKKFKEILLSIYTRPMAEQGTYLCDFIKNWMGPYEQVDDLLVIGIRI
jgi:serine phosphatase RsbU (regulator of sigma subunit)